MKENKKAQFSLSIYQNPSFQWVDPPISKGKTVRKLDGWKLKLNWIKKKLSFLLNAVWELFFVSQIVQRTSPQEKEKPAFDQTEILKRRYLQW